VRGRMVPFSKCPIIQRRILPRKKVALVYFIFCMKLILIALQNTLNSLEAVENFYLQVALFSCRFENLRCQFDVRRNAQTQAPCHVERPQLDPRCCRALGTIWGRSEDGWEDCITKLTLIQVKPGSVRRRTAIEFFRLLSPRARPYQLWFARSIGFLRVYPRGGR
jgi:hypothetical protein